MARPPLDLATWTAIFQEEAIEIQTHSWHLQFDFTIEGNQPQRGWKEYIRNTSAWFVCPCGRSWPSNKVKVVFHMCLKESGTVMVRPYRQNCKICTNAPFVEPSIEDENIRIMMTNVVKKIRIKFYDEKQDNDNTNFKKHDVKSPHEPDHCEACIKGVCKENEFAL